MIKFTLSKAERVCLQRDVEMMFAKGRSHFGHPVKLVYAERERQQGEPPVMLMVSVGKKRFRHAVDRNRIKRQLRESYRLNKQVLYGEEHLLSGRLLLIGLLYVGKKQVETESLMRCVAGLMEKVAGDRKAELTSSSQSE